MNSCRWIGQEKRVLSLRKQTVCQVLVSVSNQQLAWTVGQGAGQAVKNPDNALEAPSPQTVADRRSFWVDGRMRRPTCVAQRFGADAGCALRGACFHPVCTCAGRVSRAPPPSRQRYATRGVGALPLPGPARSGMQILDCPLSSRQTGRCCVEWFTGDDVAAISGYSLE